MTAICGWFGDRPAEELRRACRHSLDALAPWGGKAEILTSGRGVLGLTTADDDKAFAALGPASLVVDGRLDNRADLQQALGEGAGATDAELMLRAILKWRADAVPRFLGDFALAFHDSETGQLLLARDALGARPLFYARGDRQAAFASMPAGLAGVGGLPCEFDFPQCARRLVGPLYRSERTYWRGISRVRPGEWVAIERDQRRAVQYWQPAVGPSSGRSLQDDIEEFRSLLDRSVACRIADQSGPIAMHLSGGLDSGAVAATAARLCRDDQSLIAFTAAPREGLDLAVRRGLIADESSLAAKTASLHGLRHEIIRTAPVDFLEHLRRTARLYQEPVRNLINACWGSQILSRARDSGATVLLSGSFGNLGLSAGKPDVLHEWVRRGSWGRWLTEARAARASGRFSWRGILFNSFAPVLPNALWRGLRTTALGRSAIARFVRREWLPDPDALDRMALPQPSGETYRDRLELIRATDNGPFHHGALAEAGIDERDPTADRRIVEFSLRLAPERLFENGQARVLARKALTDRLPPEITEATVRGLQAADGFDQFTARGAEAVVEQIEGDAPVQEFLDLPAIKSAIRSWPAAERSDPKVRSLYLSDLPIALEAGVFLSECGLRQPKDRA